MQPHRTAKPHQGDGSCNHCTPTAPGHYLCQGNDCDEIASTQTRRHATDAEYAAIPPTLAPIDGVAHAVVFGCDDCADGGGFEAVCSPQSHVPEPVPCPKCQATGDAPCTKKDGSPRRNQHRVRADAQPGLIPCTHAHRADCNVFTDCQCSEADEAPVRPKRQSGAAHWPDMTGLLIPIPAAQMLLAQRGIAWHQVAALRNKVTQIGNQPVIEADIYQTSDTGERLHDQHGRPVTESIEIPLPVVPAAPSIQDAS